MKCSKCGKEFGESAYCQNCGVDRVTGLANYSGYDNHARSSNHHYTDNAEQTSNNMTACYACGEIIPSSSEFCPSCGKKLFVTCPKCGNKYSSQYSICNNCGANYRQSLKEAERIRREEAEREKREEAERIRREEAKREREEEEAKEAYPLLIIGCIIFTLGSGGILGWFFWSTFRNNTWVLPISIVATLAPLPWLLSYKDKVGNILEYIWGILFAILLVLVIGALMLGGFLNLIR